MKELSRSQKSESEVSKVNPRFSKIPEGQKIKRFSVHFWTFRIFFLNRGLTFETSDSDFWELLTELFHMNKKKLF